MSTVVFCFRQRASIGPVGVGVWVCGCVGLIERGAEREKGLEISIKNKHTQRR
jgi:hypothetical protein